MSWATRIRERGGQEIAPPRDPVRLASTANHVLATLVPGAAFSGDQLDVFDRIALVGQTVKAENGIYIVQPNGPPIRAIDARDPKMLVPGLFFTVEEGANASKGWMLSTDVDPITPDVTPLPFVLVGPPGSSTGPVLNPMLSDLDAGGFGIFNVRDLFVTGVGAPSYLFGFGSSAGIGLAYGYINSPDAFDNGLVWQAAGVPKWTFYRSGGPSFFFSLYDEAGARDHMIFRTGGQTEVNGPLVVNVITFPASGTAMPSHYKEGGYSELQSNGGAGYFAYTWANAASSEFGLIRGRGSRTAVAAIQSGDAIGDLSFFGQYDSTFGHYTRGARVEATAAENFDVTHAGSDLIITVVPTGGSTTLTEQLRVLGAGGIKISNGATITTGAGAPAAAQPNGSLYLRNDGAAGTTIYMRVAGAWVANP